MNTYPLLETYNMNIDKSKETILVMANRGLYEFDGLWAFTKLYTDILKEKYNVVYYNTGSAPKDIQLENLIVQPRKLASVLEKTEFKRAVEMKNNGQYNFDVYKNSLKSELQRINEETGVFLKLSKVICITEIFFPLSEYSVAGVRKFMMNEAHDYIGSKEHELTYVKSIQQKMYEKRYNYISFLFQSYTSVCKAISVLESLAELGYDFAIDTFIVDPGQAYYMYDKINPKNSSRVFYFVDDTKGTRNFKRFPIGELQEISTKYLNVYSDPDFVPFEVKREKTKDFIYMGRLFYADKNTRTEIFDQFLNGLETNRESAMYIPLQAKFSSESKTDEVSSATWNKISPELRKALENLLNHKYYKGSCLPSEVANILNDYQYTLIIPCLSFNASLNYRPYLYALTRTVPLLHEEYDPYYQQYPKHIQEKLIVKSAEDINEKIKYYNDNPKARELLLDEISELFNVEYWKSLENVKQEIYKYY